MFDQKEKRQRNRRKNLEITAVKSSLSLDQKKNLVSLIHSGKEGPALEGPPRNAIPITSKSKYFLTKYKKHLNKKNGLTKKKRRMINVV